MRRERARAHVHDSRTGWVLVPLALCLANGAGSCDRGSPKREAPAVVREVAPPPREAVPVSGAPAAAPLRLLLIADLDGVLEPCGCTSRPLGGIDRLAAALGGLRVGARNVSLFAAGDLLSATTHAAAAPRVQDSWHADALAAVLGRLGIDVVAPGARDREREAQRVVALSRAGRAVLLGTAAAAAPLDTMVSVAHLRAGEIQIGVVAVASPAANAVGAAAEQIAALRSGGAQLVIAFVHGTLATARTVAERSGAEFVVHSGDPDQAAGVSAMPNGARILHAGHHGESVLALDVWPDDKARAAAVQVRELDRNAAVDPAVRALLDQLFVRVNAHNANAYRADVSPAPAKGQASYVGSRTCAACHTQAYFWWQQTPHARAFDALVARRRQLDLDCIGCHVTGYQQPGGSTLGRLDELQGVGCESCHGPGSAHVDNPQQPGRAIRRSVPEHTCTGCHDREHSDVFRYAQARDQLLVPGHGVAMAGADPR